jgi:hypothetical protein
LSLESQGKAWTLQDDLETGGTEDISIQLREQFLEPDALAKLRNKIEEINFKYKRVKG